jgi:hypothetical protein
MSENIITGLVTGRLMADLVDEDTVNIHTELQATPESGPGMPFLLGVAMGPLQALAKSEAGLTVTGAPTWDAAKELVVGDYQVTGMKAILYKYIAKPQGGPPPAVNQPPRKPTQVPKTQ